MSTIVPKALMWQYRIERLTDDGTWMLIEGERYSSGERFTEEWCGKRLELSRRILGDNIPLRMVEEVLHSQVRAYLGAGGEQA